MDIPRRWRQTAIALAILSGVWGPGAMAFSLGRVVVHSALGEELRAEVEILDINAEEAASLKTSIALPESFKAAGLEYNPAMATLQLSLHRHADGRAYIRLLGDRAIKEPFVDMILETSWTGGRIVREYTLLFDPPSLMTTAANAPALTPALTSPPAPANQANSSASRATLTPPASKAAPAVEAANAASKTPAQPTSLARTIEQATQVIVKPGDTASKIASAARLDHEVSLDQMLVAMLHNNPSAFVGANVNRIKAGSVIDIPSTEQAMATPANQATQMILAQSQDFNDFRRKLALNAPDAAMVANERSASGSIQARVDDKKSLPATPDKLTLSGGAVQTHADQLARERRAQDALTRTAEIARNISDLDKLGIASEPTSGAPPAANAALTGAASTPASAPAPGASVSVQGATPALTPSTPQTSLLDSLIDNPLAPAGAVGLIAVLAMIGFYRNRQNQKSPSSHNSSSPPGVVGDVDPVSEAELNLAYGRDLQAEEILQDALRASPDRMRVHQKLLELFAKRGDVKAFEHAAINAYHLTDGIGPEWRGICDLGISLDPVNPMYRPGWQPGIDAPDTSPAQQASSPPQAQQPSALPDQTATAQDNPDIDLDLDLDLDFSIGKEHDAATPETSTGLAEEYPTPPQSSAEEEGSDPGTPPHPLGKIPFDLDALSLELGEIPVVHTSQGMGNADDPLLTRFALAHEFIALGDRAGARTLLDEVIAESSGELRLRAQAVLDGLEPK